MVESSIYYRFDNTRCLRIIVSLIYQPLYLRGASQLYRDMSNLSSSTYESTAYSHRFTQEFFCESDPKSEFLFPNCRIFSSILRPLARCSAFAATHASISGIFLFQSSERKNENQKMKNGLTSTCRKSCKVLFLWFRDSKWLGRSKTRN